MYNSLEEPLDLSRDMAMKLFFAADKYLIEPLRQKAINQLIPRSVEEVFPALYCITLCTTGIDTLENIVKTVRKTFILLSVKILLVFSCWLVKLYKDLVIIFCWSYYLVFEWC